MDMKDLQIGDTILSEGGSPFLFERRVETTMRDEKGQPLPSRCTYVFRDLETWKVTLVHDTFTDDLLWAKRCTLLERSQPAPSSGSVDSYRGETDASSDGAVYVANSGR